MSSSNPLAHMLYDKATSDFTIKCRSHVFAVHKAILSFRSETMRVMFSNPAFTENATNQMDLTLDPSSQKEPDLEDDDPYLVHAFLTALYTNEYPTYAQSYLQLHPEVLDEGVAPDKDDIYFHKRMSEFADRYMVTTLDSVIVSKAFGTRNKSNTQRSEMPWTSGLCEVRTDTVFLEALITIYKHAVRHVDDYSKNSIAAFVVDHLHKIKEYDFDVELTQLPGLVKAVFQEQCWGPTRLKCPCCHGIVRLDSKKLKGGHLVSRNNDRPSARAYAANMSGEHTMTCTYCEGSYPTMYWLRCWLGEHIAVHKLRFR